MKYSSYSELENFMYKFNTYPGDYCIEDLLKHKKRKEYGLIEDTPKPFTKKQLKKIYKFINQLILGLPTPEIVVANIKKTKNNIPKVKRKILKNKILLQGLLAFFDEKLTIYNNPNFTRYNLPVGMELNFSKRLIRFIFIEVDDESTLIEIEKYL